MLIIQSYDLLVDGGTGAKPLLRVAGPARREEKPPWGFWETASSYIHHLSADVGCTLRRREDLDAQIADAPVASGTVARLGHAWEVWQIDRGTAYRTIRALREVDRADLREKDTR